MFIGTTLVFHCIFFINSLVVLKPGAETIHSKYFTFLIEMSEFTSEFGKGRNRWLLAVAPMCSSCVLVVFNGEETFITLDKTAS